jgi:hypothetical protein
MNHPEYRRKMKKLLFAFCMVGINTCWAQQETVSKFVNPEWDVLNGIPNTEIQVYTLTKKGKRIDNSYLFNEQGLLYLGRTFNRRGLEKQHVRNTYNGSGKKLELAQYRKNKFWYKTVNTYQNDTLLTGSIHYTKDTLTPDSKTVYAYTPFGKYLRIQGFTGKNKSRYAIEFDYYANGSRKETRHFSKGKLKYRWVYDCKPEGAIEHMDKNTKNFCKNRTYSEDSSYTEINEYIENGKITRNVIRATPDGRIIEYVQYNAKGKQTIRFTYQYNNKQKLVQKKTFKNKSGRLKSIELFEYNNKNNLVLSSKLSANGSVKYKREYSYN